MSDTKQDPEHARLTGLALQWLFSQEFNSDDIEAKTFIEAILKYGAGAQTDERRVHQRLLRDFLHMQEQLSIAQTRATEIRNEFQDFKNSHASEVIRQLEASKTVGDLQRENAELREKLEKLEKDWSLVEPRLKNGQWSAICAENEQLKGDLARLKESIDSDLSYVVDTVKLTGVSSSGLPFVGARHAVDTLATEYKLLKKDASRYEVELCAETDKLNKSVEETKALKKEFDEYRKTSLEMLAAMRTNLEGERDKAQAFLRRAFDCGSFSELGQLKTQFERNNLLSASYVRHEENKARALLDAHDTLKMMEEDNLALRTRNAKLRQDLLDLQELVHTHPDILGGEPVIKGTRVSVRRIQRMLQRGYAIDFVSMAEAKEDPVEETPQAEKERVAAEVSSLRRVIKVTLEWLDVEERCLPKGADEIRVIQTVRRILTNRNGEPA